MDDIRRESTVDKASHLHNESVQDEDLSPNYTDGAVNDDGEIIFGGDGANKTNKEVEESVKCQACRKSCFTCTKPCRTRYNPLPNDPTRRQKCAYACLCPPHGKIGRILSAVLAILFVYAVLWSMTGKAAEPGGNFFGIIILFVFCVIGGKLVELIRLPPLLGMLIVGCLLRNLPTVNVAKDIDPVWSGNLRNIALVVILIRAGLGLDPVALRKLSFGVIRLAFIPCMIETLCAAVTSHLLLDFPWTWGFMLGFILAAVSPAVVVPSMLSLEERGYGVDKGIPTLVIAAASIDDVLAISGFGVVLGIAFSQGNLALTIVKGPLEAVAGIVYGVVFGVLAWYIPPVRNSPNKNIYRVVILFCGGLFAIFGSRAADISGAGALGCLAMAFVVALGWRKEMKEDEDMPVAIVMGHLWSIFQPLLFGLIGAEIVIENLQASTIGLGCAVLFIGLVFRMIASFLAVFGTDLNMKERLFIPFAWLPKATVQAAIGSVALDTARNKNSPDHVINLGVQVLTIAVLVIMITAPLGAAAISIMAPRLLHKSNPKKKGNEMEMEVIQKNQNKSNDENEQMLKA